MTTFQALDKSLRAAGWRYDVDTEDFYERDAPLPYSKVLALVPGMTMDELASYIDDRYDELRARYVRARK